MCLKPARTSPGPRTRNCSSFMRRTSGSEPFGLTITLGHFHFCQRHQGFCRTWTTRPCGSKQLSLRRFASQIHNPPACRRVLWIVLDVVLLVLLVLALKFLSDRIFDRLLPPPPSLHPFVLFCPLLRLLLHPLLRPLLRPFRPFTQKHFYIRPAFIVFTQVDKCCLNKHWAPGRRVPGFRGGLHPFRCF